MSEDLPAADRLIVALDVPTVDEALSAVDRLSNVSFFKVGLQLFVTGELPILLERLREKRIFVDLKIPSDIGNTIAAVIDLCIRSGAIFLTLSDSIRPPAIRSARAARDARGSEIPKLLLVPYLSSLNEEDLRDSGGGETDLETHILRLAHRAIEAGCEGLIASGDAIRICRQAFPPPTIIVSPGIRPAGAAANDHKRHTTPAQAIEFGADYLVVGRPILQAPDPKDAAQRVIDEVDQALAIRRTR